MLHRCRCDVEPREDRPLQRYADAGMLEAHGKDALVDLVELHQLQQVYEQSQTVVHGEVLPVALLTLREHKHS